MSKYGELNEAKTAIIDEYNIVEGKTPWLGKKSNPSHENWIAAGWLLFVAPVIGTQQKDSHINVLDIKEGTYTHRVDDFTAEEIAAETALLTKQEVLEFKKASPELMALIQDSDLEIDADVVAETSGASNAEVVEAIRTAIAKDRKMLRDLSIVVKAIVT